jgi:hypothetical protein
MASSQGGRAEAGLRSRGTAQCWRSARGQISSTALISPGRTVGHNEARGSEPAGGEIAAALEPVLLGLAHPQPQDEQSSMAIEGSAAIVFGGASRPGEATARRPVTAGCGRGVHPWGEHVRHRRLRQRSGPTRVATKPRSVTALETGRGDCGFRAAAPVDCAGRTPSVSCRCAERREISMITGVNIPLPSLPGLAVTISPCWPQR